MTALSILLMVSAALVADTAGGKKAILDEMTTRLLAGEAAPQNIEDRLMLLPLSERFEVIIFLRRSGILQGKSLSIDRLLSTGPRAEISP